jgi:hypothetical protein
MMKNFKNIFYAFLLLANYQCATAANRYVEFSPDNKNWISIFKNEVSNHLRHKVSGDTLFLHFKNGVYPIYESLSFIQGSSDKMNAPIVIRGEDKSVFSGGIILDNKEFKTISDNSIRNRILCVESRDKILEYDLFKSGIDNLGEINCIGFSRPREAAPIQLYFNGERMILARYPNADDPFLLKTRSTVIPIKKITNPGRKRVELPGDAHSENFTVVGGEFVYSDMQIEKWLNAPDLWVDGIFCRDWAWSLNKVSKIDTVNKTISLQYEEKYDLTGNKSFFFATNLLEEIDVPGEYYIDRESGKLYFYPPLHYNMNTSVIQLSGNTQNLLEIKGITNLKIENICFELGRFNALHIDQTSEIDIVNCTFSNLGNSAIIANGENINIENCVIRSTGGTAIDLNGGDFTTLEESNNVVHNCDISDWGKYQRVYSYAIALGGVGNKFLGNKIYFSPHGAISISGNNHLIERNEISNVILEFEDFGAIYAFSGRDQLRRGHIIRQNYFHHIGQLGERVWAIYVDEATAGWAIENNLFYKLGNPGARVGAIMGNTCSSVSIKNNLFLDCSQTFELSFHFSTWGRVRYDEYFKKIWDKEYSNIENIPAVYLDNYPELKNFLTEERIYVNTNSFINNTIGNFSIPLNHENYYLTRSDLVNVDSLVISRNNHFTKDKSLLDFLDKWNSSANHLELKEAMPELLKNYLFFKDKSLVKNNF